LWDIKSGDATGHAVGSETEDDTAKGDDTQGHIKW